MSTLLTLLAPMLPLLCEVKVFAALVLLEVSALRVVVGTTTKFPACAVTDNETIAIRLARTIVRISDSSGRASSAIRASWNLRTWEFFSDAHTCERQQTAWLICR